MVEPDEWGAFEVVTDPSGLVAVAGQPDRILAGFRDSAAVATASRGYRGAHARAGLGSRRGDGDTEAMRKKEPLHPVWRWSSGPLRDAGCLRRRPGRALRLRLLVVRQRHRLPRTPLPHPASALLVEHGEAEGDRHPADELGRPRPSAATAATTSPSTTSHSLCSTTEKHGTDTTSCALRVNRPCMSGDFDAPRGDSHESDGGPSGVSRRHDRRHAITSRI